MTAEFWVGVSTFGALGPLAGTLAMLLIVMPLQSLIAGQEFAWEILGTLPFLILFGYIFGIVAALLTGVVHQLMPRGWPRLLLSPALGALITFATILVPGALRGTIILPTPDSLLGLMLWSGAIATLACALALNRPPSRVAGE